MLLSCGVGEDSWESLDCKEIQPVHPKGDQSWVFVGWTNPEAETPIRWPPHVKSWLIGKDPDTGRGWGQEEKGTTKDEMAGWHHWLNGRESEWTLGVGDGQGGLACCDSWGCQESDTTEQLNWTAFLDLLVLISLYRVLRLCPSFKGCALPPSSLTLVVSTLLWHAFLKWELLEIHLPKMFLYFIC